MVVILSYKNTQNIRTFWKKLRNFFKIGLFQDRNNLLFLVSCKVVKQNVSSESVSKKELSSFDVIFLMK